jgi:hypothetical protein
VNIIITPSTAVQVGGLPPQPLDLATIAQAS